MNRGPPAPPAGRRGPFSLKPSFLAVFRLGSGPDGSGQAIGFIWSLFRAKRSILDSIRAIFEDLGRTGIVDPTWTSRTRPGKGQVGSTLSVRSQIIENGSKWVENSRFGPKQRPNESYSLSGPIRTTSEAKNKEKIDFSRKTAPGGRPAAPADPVS